MVWQLVVLPGTHTVIVVNSVFTSGLLLVGPASTTTLTTLEPVGVVEPTEELPDAGEAVLPPPPPPPQESADRHRAAQSPKRQACAGTTVRTHLCVVLTISANLRR